MKVGFFVFTGTGNTLRVCKILASELEANGIVTQINMIQDLHDSSIANDYDKIIVANPVHGFNPPKPMLDFLWTLPISQSKQVYLVRVSGEPLKLNNAAGILPKKILTKKGYLVMGEFMYVMPYNIIFHHTDQMATRMEVTAKFRATRDVQTILNDEFQLSKNSIFNRIISFVCRLENVALPISGKHYKTTDDCISCGLCERICPTKNIEIKDGKPVFKDTCVGCMGCAFSCPKDAIRISFLNGWRVNGAYNFNSIPATDDEICDYCKKSYLKYFHEYETKENS